MIREAHDCVRGKKNERGKRNERKRKRGRKEDRKGEKEKEREIPRAVGRPRGCRPRCPRHGHVPNNSLGTRKQLLRNSCYRATLRVYISRCLSARRAFRVVFRALNLQKRAGPARESFLLGTFSWGICRSPPLYRWDIRRIYHFCFDTIILARKESGLNASNFILFKNYLVSLKMVNIVKLVHMHHCFKYYRITFEDKFVLKEQVFVERYEYIYFMFLSCTVCKIWVSFKY